MKKKKWGKFRDSEALFYIIVTGFMILFLSLGASMRLH